MLNLSATWEQLLKDLERERDELRVKVHLGKAEARDVLAKMEHKLEEFRRKAHQIMEVAQDSADSLHISARTMATDIREGFKRVRELL